MRRYRLPNGRVRPTQPGVRLEQRFLAGGAVLVEDDDPTLLDAIPAKDLAVLQGLDREERWALTDWARAAAVEVGAPAPPPGPLDHDDPAEIVAAVDDFDYDTLEQLIRDETSGRNRQDVLDGLQRLRDNAPGNKAEEIKKAGGAKPT